MKKITILFLAIFATVPAIAANTVAHMLTALAICCDTIQVAGSINS